MNLIFCIYPRCGSTVLCLSLQKSCMVDVCHEPCSIDEIPDYCNISKIMSNLNDEQTNKKFIDNSRNILLLYRQNMLDVILSEHMSLTFKTKSGIQIWNTIYNTEISDEDKKDFYKTRRQAIDFSNVRFKISEARNRLKLYTEYIDRKKKNMKIIAYEDLYNDMENFVMVCDFFGYAVKNNSYQKLMSPKNKINNTEIYPKLIPNYNEFKREFKNEICDILL